GDLWTPKWPTDLPYGTIPPVPSDPKIITPSYYYNSVPFYPTLDATKGYFYREVEDPDMEKEYNSPFNNFTKPYYQVDPEPKEHPYWKKGGLGGDSTTTEIWEQNMALPVQSDLLTKVYDNYEST
ncbi:MAG: hypothetical protein EZS28_053485, partial [Streblomastix strix]